jgi:predicted amidohydrolase YtcJ
MTTAPALVFRNGHVFTSDAAGSGATALAVRDGRVAALGGDAEVVGFLDGADEVVDLRGRMLLPGFVDAHVHPVMAGLERNRCDLSELPDLAAYRDAVVRYAAARPEVSWILGGGWSMEAFPHGLPHRDQLDDVTAGRPAYFPNRDHHSGGANSAALERAGIDRDTPDPADGRIERDADGEPTGALHEGAMELVEKVLPPETQHEYDDALRTALAHLHSLGITGWQDAWVETDLTRPGVHAAYLRAATEGWLTARVSAALWWERATAPDDVETEVRRLAALRDETNALGLDRYDVHSVKIMQDGVAETFTAALLEPYLDACGCATDNSGISFLPPELLTRVVGALDATGFQVHVHALGDRAVRDALDAIEAARASNGSADRRHQLAHLQVVDPADVPRFRALGVTANLQALWACHEPQMDELTIPFLGERRAALQYPFGDLFRSGATLAMGSDWPVSSPHPMQAIHVAVNRFEPGRPSGSTPLCSGQELALATALRAYTAGSAYANRREADTGTLRVGAAADLVVLDRDPFTVPAHELGDVGVDRVYVAGEPVTPAVR